MTKLFALICILISVANAADTGACLTTLPLKVIYGFSEASLVMTTPKAYSDLKYCTSLASGACCTDTDINNFATMSQARATNLTTTVSTRDTYITTVKNTVLPTLLTNVQNFNAAVSKFLTSFTSQMESGSISMGNMDESDLDIDMSDIDMSDIDMSDIDMSDIDMSEIEDEEEQASSSLSIVTEVTASFGYLANITTQFLTQIDSIKSNYGNYQNARRTCVLDMLDIENSAMCLACDPNAANNGFSNFADMLGDLSDLEDESELEDEDESEFDESEFDESDFDESDFDESDFEDSDIDYSEEEVDFELGFGIAMSPATCSRLQASCNPYLALAEGQNLLIEVTSASSAFSALTTAMQAFSANNYQAALDDFEKVAESNDTTSSVPALVGGMLPYGCNPNGNCEWVCAGLFQDGVVNQAALLVGGEVDDGEDDEEDDGERRRLLANKRRLDGDGTWAPAKGSSGVAVTFAADPANTDSNGKKFGSLNLGNVFVGMMVMISSILLF